MSLLGRPMTDDEAEQFILILMQDTVKKPCQKCSGAAQYVAVIDTNDPANDDKPMIWPVCWGCRNDPMFEDREVYRITPADVKAS